MTGLPTSLTAFGPAALAAVVVAAYLVVGEPAVGAVLHRRFEGRLTTEPGARRSFYVRLLILEWGLAVLAVVVWSAAPGVSAAQVGLHWPQHWPGPVTAAAVLAVLVFAFLSARALRMGVLVRSAERAEGGRHAEHQAQSVLALLPRTPGERRLFSLVGLTAGICEEWLYRGFFLAVVSAVAGGLPLPVLVLVSAVAFGVAHAYQGAAGIALTGVLGGIMAALYLQTGSLLPPVALHALVDLRFLLVPAAALPAVGRGAP